MRDLTTKQMQQILNNNLLNYSDFKVYDKKRRAKFSVKLVVLDTTFKMPLPVSETEFNDLVTLIVYDLGHKLPLGGDKL